MKTYRMLTPFHITLRSIHSSHWWEFIRVRHYGFPGASRRRWVFAVIGGPFRGLKDPQSHATNPTGICHKSLFHWWKRRRKSVDEGRQSPSFLFPRGENIQKVTGQFVLSNCLLPNPLYIYIVRLFYFYAPQTSGTVMIHVERWRTPWFYHVN
jgi:hypothetical protein